MKKIICMVSALALVVVTALSASAAVTDNEQKVLDAINSGVTVNGQTVKVPADYVNQATTYLSQNNITAEQADAIVAEIDAAKEIIKEAGVTDLSKLTGAQKSALVERATAAAKVVDLTLTYDSTSKTITIKNAAGEVVFKAEEAIKTTGADANPTAAIVIGISILGVIALAGYSVKKFHLVAA
jgi:hypothetical protein